VVMWNWQSIQPSPQLRRTSASVPSALLGYPRVAVSLALGMRISKEWDSVPHSDLAGRGCTCRVDLKLCHEAGIRNAVGLIDA
jgi:hypothetical protein